MLRIGGERGGGSLNPAPRPAIGAVLAPMLILLLFLDFGLQTGLSSDSQQDGSGGHARLASNRLTISQSVKSTLYTPLPLLAAF